MIFGTVASLTANSILAPCRMMPCFSTADPTMKPGTSCRNTSGMLNASHSHTKRAALSAAFTSSAPPSTIGWFATMPTGWPPTRASPVTRFFAHSGFIQKHVAVVDDRVHDLAHVVRAPWRGRHDVVELLDAPVDGIVGRARCGGCSRLCCGKNDRYVADDREALRVVGDLEVGDAARSWCAPRSRPSPPR